MSLNQNRDPFDSSTSRDPFGLWQAIRTILSHRSLISCQIESFDSFITHSIPRIIENSNKIPLGEKTWIELVDPVCLPPSFTESEGDEKKILPMECRYRNITYSSNIYCDILVYKNGQVQSYKKTWLGFVPVMLKSCLCNLTSLGEDDIYKNKEDPIELGGYFLIKGNEKVLPLQKRSCFNKAYVFFNRKKPPKYELYTEIRSTSIGSSHSTTLTIGTHPDGTFTSLVPYIPEKNPIPLIVLYRALGFISEKEICETIYPPTEEFIRFLIPSFERSFSVRTQEDALEYIGKKGKKYVEMEEEEDNEDDDDEEHVEYISARDAAISYAKHLLDAEVLPHLGKDSIKKGFFIGYMVSKALFVRTGKKMAEERDHGKNMRVTNPNQFLSSQFYTALKRMCKEAKLIGEKAVSNGTAIIPSSLFKAVTIGNAMAVSVGTGNGKGQAKTGISQMFEHYNWAMAHSNLRKLSTPVSKDGGKLIAPRNLHETHYGIVDPSETPEGKKVGVVNNLALLSYVTVGSDHESLAEIVSLLKWFIPFEGDIKSLLGETKVMVNGTWIGFTKNHVQLRQAIIEKRRGLDISPEVSVGYSSLWNEIRIFTEEGRLCRPLVIVREGKIPDLTGKSFTELFNGFVEYIDKEEEENLLIAFYAHEVTLKHTHCELHPSLMYGMVGSQIPYANFNQSPRNSYEENMLKQSVSVPFLNFRHQMTGKFTVMNYIQKPLVETKQSRITGMSDVGYGQMGIVAICPYGGDNQEDSLVFKKEAIDRGFACIDQYYTYYSELKEGEEFGVPTEKECGRFIGNTRLLDEDGVPGEGDKIEPGDVVIGKLSRKQKDKKEICENKSITYDEMHGGVIYKIQAGLNSSNYRYVRIVVVQKRPPTEGSKFASRFGQKGVLSRIVREVDLPFSSKDGIIPDIVMSPLAHISRMTLGNLIELFCGKTALINPQLNNHTIKELFPPRVRDCTSFEKSLVKDLKKELEAQGYNGFGDDYLIDGITGERLKALIFIGPVYYQRLRHMVEDKMSTRARGKRTAISRQASCGRADDGGLRTGTMERDILSANGASAILLDRLFEQSDDYAIWICKRCGLPGVVTKDGRMKCNICQDMNLELVKLPYGMKLLMQEMLGMNIPIRILVTPHGPKLEIVS